ncbi:MAG: ATPase [Culturomica sp.]|nr:ATPase [Culturomica sp.]
MRVDVIADSGATKTEWCVVGEVGMKIIHRTAGINPIHLSDEEIREILEREVDFAKNVDVNTVFFYGAGCSFASVNSKMERIINDFFKANKTEVASDLLAAARSLCVDRAGVCGILGTGSNTCVYDGERIVKNVPALGYVLGDEGSGAFLGKKLLANVLKGTFSKEIRELFFAEYPFKIEEFINKVYRLSQPNRFLASLTLFLSKHADLPEIDKLLEESFNEFIERNLLLYEEVRDLPIYFTGGIAYTFHSQLCKSLAAYGLSAHAITQSPMNGLIAYHSL